MKELELYTDILIAESLLSDPRITKEAQSGIASSIMSAVSEYVSGKIEQYHDSDSKAEFVISLLVPGILRALGFPILGVIAMVAEHVFNVNIGGIFTSIASDIKSAITGGNQTTSEHVDSVVEKAVSSNMGADPSDEEIDNKVKSLNLPDVTSKLTFQDAQILKISFYKFVNNNNLDVNNIKFNIKFAAGFLNSHFATFVRSKGKLTKILIALIGFVVKSLLGAAGFMVAGDMISKLLGKSPTPSKSTPDQPSLVSVPSSQKVFKPASNYVPEGYNGPNSRWIFQGNDSSIEPMLIEWTTEIYPDLKGHEDLITSSNNFNKIVSTIQAFNQGNSSNMMIMPRALKSRKQVVDMFIDEVASKFSSNSKEPSTKDISAIPNASQPPKPNSLNISYKHS